MSYHFSLGILPETNLDTLPIADDAKSLANGLGRQVYVVSFGGVADTHAIEAAGGLDRLRAQTAGQLVRDQGAPLAAESALDGHEYPEDAHVAVFQAFAGQRSRGRFRCLVRHADPG